MPGSVVETLSAYAQEPLLIGLLLIFATFVLEDPATVAGAVLASEGMIHPLAALAALYIGIVLGDLGLYGLGWLGARNRMVQRFLQRKRVARAGDWMGARLVPTIFASRFVPGMRLPVYTAAGLFALPFRRFLLTVLFAVALWTGALFWAIYLFGEAVLDDLGPWRWAVVAALLFAIVVLPRLIRRLLPSNALPDTARPEIEQPPGDET